VDKAMADCADRLRNQLFTRANRPTAASNVLKVEIYGPGDLEYQVHFLGISPLLAIRLADYWEDIAFHGAVSRHYREQNWIRMTLYVTTSKKIKMAADTLPGTRNWSEMGDEDAAYLENFQTYVGSQLRSCILNSRA
jgi:hypothetical protein